ncbi:hypothetical protein VTI74DRAFT_4874 [Chaetomium olivicolor]
MKVAEREGCDAYIMQSPGALDVSHRWAAQTSTSINLSKRSYSPCLFASSTTRFLASLCVSLLQQPDLDSGNGRRDPAFKKQLALSQTGFVSSESDAVFLK